MDASSLESVPLVRGAVLLRGAFSANELDRAFAAALPIARAFVEASIRRKAAKFRAEAMVMTAIDAAGEGHVLDLPMGMPFRGAVVKAGADHLLFGLIQMVNLMK